MHYAKPPEMARLRPAYLMRHGLFLVHLVFANKIAYIVHTLRTRASVRI